MDYPREVNEAINVLVRRKIPSSRGFLGYRGADKIDEQHQTLANKEGLILVLDKEGRLNLLNSRRKVGFWGKFNYLGLEIGELWNGVYYKAI